MTIDDYLRAIKLMADELEASEDADYTGEDLALKALTGLMAEFEIRRKE